MRLVALLAAVLCPFVTLAALPAQAAGASAAAAVGVADAWPSFRGPRGDGLARTGLPAGEGALALSLRWQVPLGSGYSGIAVAGDLLVTAGQAEADDVVVALSTADGSERWRASLGPAYAGHDGSHDGPIATPTIADGRVFALSARGRLMALDAATGAVLWQREVASELAAPAPFYGYGSSPRVVGDRVVLWIGGEVGSVAAFDVATGELRWRQLEESTDAQSPMIATLGGREQVVVIGGTHLAGLDPADGAVLWQLEHGGGPTAMGAPTSSPLLLGDDRIFFKHGADTSMVVKVARAQGAAGGAPALAATVEREVRALARSYSPPALAGKLLVGYTGRFLSAVDPASGEILWRSREPGDGFLVAVEDQLVVLTKEGSLHLAPLDRAGWHEAARLELFREHAWSPPAVVGSSVFARSLGSIARVDLVRAAAAPVVADEPVPEVLAPLAAELAAAADSARQITAATRFFAGRPLPIVDGEEVVFVWRGRGADLAIAGDMIGMRSEEPMHRLGSSDVWWWHTRLDRRARVSYVFLVDNEPAVDPAHQRRVSATVLGPDLNWQRAQGMQMSWLAMPDWPGHELVANAARGRIERFDVAVPKPDSKTGETVAVRCTAWLPPGYGADTPGSAAGSVARLPVVYVLDRNAFEHGRWAETLDRVVGRTVQPLVAVFVEAPRGVDLQAHFASAIVPAVDARLPTQTDRAGRATVAMGWNSHTALTLALAHPELIGGVGMQSYYAVEEMMAEIAPLLDKASPTTSPLRLYFEWGRWDLRSPFEGMDMHASSVWLDGRLRARGFQPIGGEVADSTDFASWRNRTDVLLESLFPVPGLSGSGLAAWLITTEPAGPTSPAN